MRPAGEFMQAAKPRHALGAGPQHQMIGIAQDDVGADAAHLVHIHRLDRAAGADRHEGRRADFAARHGDDAAPRLAVGRENLEAERLSH